MGIFYEANQMKAVEGHLRPVAGADWSLWRFSHGPPLILPLEGLFQLFFLYLGPQFDLPVRPCPVGLGNRILLAIEPDCCFPHTVKWYSANDSQQGRSRDILSLRTRAI